MAEGFSIDQAKEILENGVAEAQELLSDPAKIDELLANIKAQVANLPETVTGALADVPTMISMVKSYVTKEYTEVSPKVVATVVAALLYLVKGKDLISDNIPILGLADDLAVVTAAMIINKPELEAFAAWQAEHVPAEEAPEA